MFVCLGEREALGVTMSHRGTLRGAFDIFLEIDRHFFPQGGKHHFKKLLNLLQQLWLPEVVGWLSSVVIWLARPLYVSSHKLAWLCSF